MMKIPASIFISIAVLIAGAVYVRMPREVPGEILLSEFKRTSMNSATSWYLYEITPEKYCMRKTGFPFDEYYCVSRKEMVIQSKISGVTEIGFIGEDDISLRNPKAE